MDMDEIMTYVSDRKPLGDLRGSQTGEYKLIK